MRSDNGLL